MMKFQPLLKEQQENYESIIAVLPLEPWEKQLLRTCWLNAIKVMDTLCKRHACWHDFTNIALIVLSALVPVLLAINGNAASTIHIYNTAVIKLPADLWKQVAIVVSMLVAILHGVRQSYKFSERVKNFRQAAEQLKQEGDKYFALSDGYSRYDHKKAFPLFIAAIAKIRGQQVEDYISKIFSSTSDDETIARNVRSDLEKSLKPENDGGSTSDPNIQFLMKTEMDMVTKYVPAIKKTDIDFSNKRINIWVEGDSKPLDDKYTFVDERLHKLSMDVNTIQL